MLPGTSTQPSRLPMATPIRSAVPSSRNSDTCFLKQGSGESDPFSRAPDPRKKDCPRTGIFNRHRCAFCRSVQLTEVNRASSSNATHRGCLWRHPSALRERPVARSSTLECRADTQLAMIGVDNEKGVDRIYVLLESRLARIPARGISTNLDTALAAAYGDRAQFEKQRHVLLEDYKGVETVLSCTSATRIRAEKRLPEN